MNLCLVRGRKNVSNGDALCGYVGCNTHGYFHQFLGRLLVVHALVPFGTGFESWLGADQARWRKQRIRSHSRIALISLKMVGFRLVVDTSSSFATYTSKQLGVVFCFDKLLSL